MVLLLLACAPQLAPQDAAPLPDEAAVEAVVQLIEPVTALGLLDTLMGELPDCDPASFEDGSGLRETWTCPTFDGTVDRYEDEDLVWMEVNGLLLETFRMDGAIELVVEDRVSTLELAATLCGDDWADCEEPIQADLTWTLIEEMLIEKLAVRAYTQCHQPAGMNSTSPAPRVASRTLRSTRSSSSPWPRPTPSRHSRTSSMAPTSPRSRSSVTVSS